MIVVADTSPLNYLILLLRSELLPGLFGRVLVPDAVLTEMQHPDAPPKVKAWAAAPPAWLERVQVKVLDGSLALELGMGEREAISLALERRADFLLIDELAGRREAVTRHLTVAGTLAILLQAALLGHLELPAEIAGCASSASMLPGRSKLTCWDATRNKSKHDDIKLQRADDEQHVQKHLDHLARHMVTACGQRATDT